MNNIAIIGGSGFLGINLALELANKKKKITLFDIKKPNKIINKYKNIEFQNLNIQTEKSIKEKLKKYKIIYYFASIADLDKANEHPKNTIDINLICFLNFLEQIKDLKLKRILFASSMYVFNDMAGFYSATKLACELFLESYSKKFKIPFTIIRYGSLYGTYSQDWNGLRKYIKEILENKKIIYYGTGDEEREYIHIKDAASISTTLLNKQYENKAVTITGTQKLKSKEVLEMIFEILNLRKNIIYKKNKQKEYHYKLTPYKLMPTSSKKIILNEFIDIGQGVYDEILNIKKNDLQE